MILFSLLYENNVVWVFTVHGFGCTKKMHQLPLSARGMFAAPSIQYIQLVDSIMYLFRP